MAANLKQLDFNFNPWGKYIPDCSIRAISAATGLDYRVVCNMLKMSYKNGYGLIRDTGVQLETIKEVFNEYFDIIEDFYENNMFVPDEFKDTQAASDVEAIDAELGLDNVPTGITLNEFIDSYKNNGTFLVSLVGNPDAKNPAARDGGHIVCVKCNKGKRQGFIDFWDSGEMLVDAFMRIKKTEPAGSPKHWKYDHEKHKFIV